MDDGSAVVPYADAYFFCKHFAELGEPLGCILNPKKSHILTATNGVSPLAYISDDHQDTVLQAMVEFTKGKEQTMGIRVLGFPVGGLEFAKAYLEDKIADVNNNARNVGE